MAASDRDGPVGSPAIKRGVQSAASLAPGGAVAIPDDVAFAAAYDAEFEAVWLYLRRLGVPEADVEDAVHDVFVVAHRRYGTYDPSRPLRPWLLGIGFRIAAQWRRRHRLEVTVAEPEPERLDDARSPDEVVASAGGASSDASARARSSHSAGRSPGSRSLTAHLGARP